MESKFFVVGEWVANPRSNSIRRQSRRSVLPPRLMDLLVFLSQHPMEVVTRQEIIDSCWDRGVVTDQAITQSIFELRKYLRDSRTAQESPEYIKTVPKRGYRLVAEVKDLSLEEYQNLCGTQNVRQPSNIETTPTTASTPPDESFAVDSLAQKIIEEQKLVDASVAEATIAEPKKAANSKPEVRGSHELEGLEGRGSVSKKQSFFSRLTDALWLDQTELGFKKGAY